MLDPKFDRGSLRAVVVDVEINIDNGVQNMFEGSVEVEVGGNDVETKEDNVKSGNDWQSEELISLEDTDRDTLRDDLQSKELLSLKDIIVTHKGMTWAVVVHLGHL